MSTITPTTTTQARGSVPLSPAARRHCRLSGCSQNGVGGYFLSHSSTPVYRKRDPGSIPGAAAARHAISGSGPSLRGCLDRLPPYKYPRAPPSFFSRPSAGVWARQTTFTGAQVLFLLVRIPLRSLRLARCVPGLISSLVLHLTYNLLSILIRMF